MKIFVVLSRVPYPLEKGDKLRAFHQLKALSKRHQIYLFLLNDAPLHKDAIPILSQFCQEIRVFRLSKFSIIKNVALFFLKGLPIQCGYFYNKNAQKEIHKWLDELQTDHIYAQLIRTAEYVKKRREPKTLDYQDVMSKGMQRLWAQAKFLKKLFFKMEYKRVLGYERDIFPFFDHKTIITQIDRDLIHHPDSRNIVVVPNGVDTELFSPLDQAKNYDLIFTGNMSYLPNVDACEYLVKEILPHLLKKYPHIRLVLCGANPARRVLALRSRNVHVTGWVDDIKMYYAQSRIFIAPMQLGTGLQNKLLEAMAMQIPCITSPLAGEPIKAKPNEEILTCNSILGYIDAIEILLNNPDFYHKIASNGYRFVRNTYNWDATTQILEDVMTEQPTENKVQKIKKVEKATM